MHKTPLKHFKYVNTAAIRGDLSPFSRFFWRKSKRSINPSATTYTIPLPLAPALVDIEPPKKRSRMKDTASFILENMKKNAGTAATYCVGKLPPYWQDVVRLGWKSATEEKKSFLQNAIAHFSLPEQKAVSILTGAVFVLGFWAILNNVSPAPLISAGWFSVSFFSLAFGFMTTTLAEFYSQFALFSKKSKTRIKNTFGHLISRSLLFGTIIGTTVSAIGTANALNFANYLSDAMGGNPLIKFAFLYICLQAWMLLYSFSFVALRDRFIEKRINSESKDEREKNLKNSFASAYKAWLFTIPVDAVFCALMLPFSGIILYPIAMIATIFNSGIRTIATEQRWDISEEHPPDSPTGKVSSMLLSSSGKT